MRLHCRLRELRGKRKLVEISAIANLAASQLSQIERGFQLPREAWLSGLERAYGAPPHQWYPDYVLLVIDRSEEAA